MTDTYENDLWTFLNLEEDDQEKLIELAHEVKNKTGENYFKLKLKIAVQSKEEDTLDVLEIKNDDLLVKESDSAELILLKRKYLISMPYQLITLINHLQSNLSYLSTKTTRIYLFKVY